MSNHLKNIFFYHTLLFLAKELYNSNHNLNDEIFKHINDASIDLKKYINRKKIPENENPEKISILLKKSVILITNKKVKDIHVC